MENITVHAVNVAKTNFRQSNVSNLLKARSHIGCADNVGCSTFTEVPTNAQNFHNCQNWQCYMFLLYLHHVISVNVKLDISGLYYVRGLYHKVVDFIGLVNF